MSIVKSFEYALTENLLVSSRSNVVSATNLLLVSSKVVVPVSNIISSKLTRPVTSPLDSKRRPCGSLLALVVLSSYRTGLLLLILARTSISDTCPVSIVPKSDAGQVTTPAMLPIIVKVKYINSLSYSG